MLYVWMLILNVGPNSPEPRPYASEGYCHQVASMYAERNYVPDYWARQGRPWYECRRVKTADAPPLGKHPEAASSR